MSIVIIFGEPNPFKLIFTNKCVITVTVPKLNLILPKSIPFRKTSFLS